MLLLIRGEHEEEPHAFAVNVARDVIVPIKLFAGLRVAKRGDNVDLAVNEDDVDGSMASITRPRSGNQ